MIKNYDYLAVMVRYLQYWEEGIATFGNSKDLALSLIARCRDDYFAGVRDPEPWLVLADLIEDTGRRTSIRHTLPRAFDLSKLGR